MRSATNSTITASPTRRLPFYIITTTFRFRSSSRGAEAYIVNAAQSRIYGLEDDFKFDLNEHFQVIAGAAWTHARYLQFGGSLNAAAK